MEDTIINILIVNDSDKEIKQFSDYLAGPGHNLLIANNFNEANEYLSKIEIGIVLASSQLVGTNWSDFIRTVNADHSYSERFVIATGNNELIDKEIDALLNTGISDFIVSPYSKTKITSKINIFKRLYFKNRTIVSLLENILPLPVLQEFKQHNKYTPKRHTNCAILFTDFIGFSKKALSYKPNELLKILDFYFTEFDHIFEKYKIEKIKTIGDSYMAVAGLHDDTSSIEIKMALAAIEIRKFINEDIAKRKSLKQDFWEVRIGIHSGNLIAGVIGSSKFAFDVWGDSVNVASRCEQHALPNTINVSGQFRDKIEPYFKFTDRGNIKVKNRGIIQMFLIDTIQPEFAEDEACLSPNLKLREIAELPRINFEGIRQYIIQSLTNNLDKNLKYHSLKHTLNVEKAVIKYAKLEGISDKHTVLLRTAALFHDSGYIYQYQQNEKYAVKHFASIAKNFGYTQNDILFINQAIMITSRQAPPDNIYEKIMCDADHDYLGKKDYHVTAQLLREELAIYGEKLTEEEWLRKQIDYLDKSHVYYTNSARNIRQSGKLKRIKELKDTLANTSEGLS